MRNSTASPRLSIFHLSSPLLSHTHRGIVLSGGTLTCVNLLGDVLFSLQPPVFFAASSLLWTICMQECVLHEVTASCRTHRSKELLAKGINE